MDCTACQLHETRTQIVRGEGECRKGIMFIGEAPGGDEDLAGRPFVGTAGKTLRAIISDAGLSESDIRITNICKCRPPGNRRPKPAEIKACRQHLFAEIDLYKPRVIVAVGLTAAQTLLGVKSTMAELIQSDGLSFQGIPVRPVYHTSPLCINRVPGAREQIRTCIEKIARNDFLV